jgi:hypothetical protein
MSSTAFFFTDAAVNTNRPQESTPALDAWRFPFATHSNALPLILYGADNLQQRVTYCLEAGSQIRSTTTAADYRPRQDGRSLTPVCNRMAYPYHSENTFESTFEAFIIHWTGYLCDWMLHSPPASLFARFKVIYHPPAEFPMDEMYVCGVKNMDGFRTYVQYALIRQATHEAAVHMLQQVMGQSHELIPACYLLSP